MKDYRANFNKVIHAWLPPHKRKPKRLRWLGHLAAYLQVLQNRFADRAGVLREEVAWNGQKILLERRLNQVFGEGITIRNRDLSDQATFMADTPDEANFLMADTPGYGNRMLADTTVGTFTTEGFTVEVPAALAADLNQVRAVVEFYRIGASSFKVEEL